MSSPSRFPWPSTLCSAVALAGARAWLMFLQDDYLGRGLPALAYWSLSSRFLTGVPWAFALALVGALGLRRRLVPRGLLLAVVALLGLAFATCRLPEAADYVPALESTRGWLGNATGLAAGVACALLLAFPAVFGRLAAAGALAVVLAAGVALVAIPALTRREEPPPFSVGFRDVTAESGIESLTCSWSIAWGDFDADGWPEPWLSNHGDPQLYRNLGGRFERLPFERAPTVGGDHHGAAWADFDGDGDQDLLELAGAERGTGSGGNHLYVYEGERFAERAAELGLDYPQGRGRTPLWLDWNDDGALDVVLLCATREEVPSALFLQRDESFVEAGPADGFRPSSSAMFGQLAALAGRGSRHMLVQANEGSPQQVLDLRRTPPAGVMAELGIPVTQRSEDVAIADFDGDLEADLFVARRRIQSEVRRLGEDNVGARLLAAEVGHGFSFRCDGPLTVTVAPFLEMWWSSESILIGAARSHPAEANFRVEPDQARGRWSDLVVAGLPEKAVVVLWDPATGRWTLRMHGAREEVHLRVEGEGPITDVERIGFAPSKPVRNAVYLRREHGFEDFSDRLLALHQRLYEGLSRHELLGFGTECAGLGVGDFDNDMDVDVYAVCSTEVSNLDNVLFENLGDGRFRALSGGAGAPGSPLGIGDAVAVADHDRDGFLDLLVSNGRGAGPSVGPVQLYQNGGNGNHWLEIDLQGTRSNREALGAQVFLTAGGRTQVRFQGGGMHRGAQDFRRLHFGLGPNERVEELLVLWPSGEETRLNDLEADRILLVVE